MLHKRTLFSQEILDIPNVTHLYNLLPKGVGPTSDWRLMINYLTRSNGHMPDGGVPFTAILTISDPEGDAPVFNDLRQNLQALGVQISDIRTAIRITPRV